MNDIFMVTAWNNGKDGYGFCMSEENRDKYFSRDISPVHLRLPGEPELIEVNTNKSSFWNSCRELIGAEIGDWLKKKKYAPWEKGKPPKFKMKKISKDKYVLLGEWSD